MQIKKLIVLSTLAVMLVSMFLPICAFAQEKETKSFISQSYLELSPGETETIKTQMSDPSMKIYYRSADMSIASVNTSGVVTAHGPGETIIRIFTEDQVLEECSVTVNKVEIQPWIYAESVTPEVIAEEPPKAEVKHYHFFQGDSKWKLSAEIRKKACVMTAMSMLLKNLGEDATPRKVYLQNGSTGMGFQKALMSYGRSYSAALSYDSEYIKAYDVQSGRTFINDSEKNYEAAVKEALEIHPEGVLCYFVNDRGQHAVVAVDVDENGVVYYNDPGRSSARGEYVTFRNTWCSHSHKMSYGNFAFFMAIN